MSRYLTPGLLTEGPEDEAFLSELVIRQLDLMSAESVVGFETGAVQSYPCRTVASAVDVTEAATVLLGYCDIVLVHHDHNERDKFTRLREAVDATSQSLVGVIPVRETEAWQLADRGLLAELLPGADLLTVPDRVKDLEKLADPKKVLAGLVGRRSSATFARLLGESVDLARLAQLSAYQRFLDDLNSALKELTFL